MPLLRPETLRASVCAVVVLLWLGLALVTGAGTSPRLHDVLLCAVTLGAAVGCAVRAALVERERAVWALFAVALAGYGSGFVLVFAEVGQGAGPFGMNVSDLVSLLLYPAGYAALVTLTRARVSEWQGATLLDGAAVALGLGACALVWISNTSPALLEGSLLEVLYTLAYPVGGATLLVATLAGMAVTRSRPDDTWGLLLLGFAALTVGQLLYAAQSAAGTFAFGTWLDALYTAGPVLVCLSAWSEPRSEQESAEHSSAVTAVPGLATAAALVVLVDRSPELPRAAVVLAAATVVAAVARMVLSVRQDRLLVQRTREARTDELTGLSNRRALLSAVDEALDAVPSGDLLLLELERFRQVNDTLGHSAGDELLKEVARRLRGVLPHVAAARLGGGSFAVLLPAPEVRGLAVSEQLRAALAEPLVLDGCDLALTARFALAAWDPSSLPGSGELLRRAHAALHAAKESGAPCEVWTTRHDEGAREQLALVSDLQAALGASDQLFVHLQPKSDPRTQAVLGVEALVRWRHPRRGLVPPDGFIDAAERAGLLPQLTVRVLELSLGHVAELRRAGHAIQVAVNVGAPDLLDPRFPATVAKALDRHAVPPQLLRLEVTETVVMSDPERVLRTLGLLRAIGVGLSLDDYGTGLSSLTYLRSLPVDELKIDRSFVQRIVDDPASGLIVGSTIALAHGLGLKVVAEGVEDEQTLAALNEAGCDVVQGFLLGRPVTVDQLVLAPVARRGALVA